MEDPDEPILVIDRSLVLFAVGLFVMFHSITWGSEAANTYLRAQGGGMDGTQFSIVLDKYMDVYRWMGGILALVGGRGFLRSLDIYQKMP